MTATTTSNATVWDLLRQRAELPAGHPTRAELRARSIEAAMPMAERLAARYRGRGEPFDDLYQVACLALVVAVDGYDPTRRTSFTAYAVPTITGALKRHFRDTTWRIRVPRRVQELALHLATDSDSLAQQLGPPVSSPPTTTPPRPTSPSPVTPGRPTARTRWTP